MRKLPWYGWLGLLTIVGSQAGVFARVDPFYHWHTPIAWTGFILAADAFVWKRRGSSWIRNSPAELLFAASVSVPVWVDLRDVQAVSDSQLVLPRAARPAAGPLPGLCVGVCDDPARDLRSCRSRRVRARSARATGPARSSCTGAARRAWVGERCGRRDHGDGADRSSTRTYLAAPVWLGFILLIDPLNARAGNESIIGDWARGHSDRLVNLLAAGLICGVLWEFWNYWSGTKWIYNVPILPEVKLFEMPVLGFGGFPPFAVECFAIYVAIRRLFWRSAARPVGV